MPEKLKDCISNDATKTEIFIVEGDSAGGSAVEGRNLLIRQYFLFGVKCLMLKKQEKIRFTETTN